MKARERGYVRPASRPDPVLVVSKRFLVLIWGGVVLGRLTGCYGNVDPAGDSGVDGTEAGDPPQGRQNRNDAETRVPGDPGETPDAGAVALEFVPCEPRAFEIGGVVVCDRCAPHGFCPMMDPVMRQCLCDDRYAGETCNECADGYVEHEGSCVTPCEAAGVPCPGICSGSVTDPVCECRIGYQGELCDQCAPGFEPVSLYTDVPPSCLPTCEGRCSTLETCLALSAGEQRCQCLFGYHRDESGACVWDGLLDDPEFAFGCAGWRLTVFTANPDHLVTADIAEGELRLSVSHVCSFAMATADASLPVPETMPHAGLRFSANGSVGAVLGVSFEDRSDFPAPITGGAARTARGIGEWQEHVVCLDPRRQAEPAVVQFGVGQSGLCEERIDHRFSVRSLSIVSDPACE